MPLSVSCAAGGRIGAGLFVALRWCWRVDSNHRPTDYESVALPAELRQPASRARRVSPHYISGPCCPFSGLRARADDDVHPVGDRARRQDRKSTRLNSSHRCISYAVFCLKKKNERLYERSVIHVILYTYHPSRRGYHQTVGPYACWAG